MDRVPLGWRNQHRAAQSRAFGSVSTNKHLVIFFLGGALPERSWVGGGGKVVSGVPSAIRRHLRWWIYSCHSLQIYDTQDQAPKLIAWILHQIALLYQIEERLRETKAGPALREAVRASESRMIHRRLHKAIIKLSVRGILPRTKLGKAITYALNQLQQYLEGYLTDVLTRLPAMKSSEPSILTVTGHFKVHHLWSLQSAPPRMRVF
jgi:hypothetical protein